MSFLGFLRDQRVRFLAVGATNTAVGYLVFSFFTLWVFADVYLGYLISLALSYVVGITLAFVLYRRFVFVVHGHVLRDFARFVSVYLVAIGINAAALPLLVEIVRVPPLLAQLIILLVTTLLSFFGHKKFSFRRGGEHSEGEPPIADG
ncbi:GtrA family protein [Cryobacterium sp. TMT1-3]|uniref:GtrA family protein n=1 Tax=Cryobacterium luteum TaxID=1424661 RepID=A0A1H8CKR8_9MICO|nr:MULTISPECIES: GtrA family protein [Cryobacterium]TFB89385.1 GtrA family protein [Cryobacterium luteum]TFC27322.1 GtrA family protein [Cryobacterium sp. TMT1-3]SEM94687.1 Putative flippase GtrA (transmembrane translocase of bactoprenol-linked glucose) [Cryobacterium luteum]